jgi:putative ABC transport system permease protein
MAERRATSVAWRVLTMAQLREQPLRLAATVLAIALGVALGAAVFLINNAALAEFDAATRRLTGQADIVIRGPAAGFDEWLLVSLSRDGAVAAASPVIERELALAQPPSDGVLRSLKLLGLDPFRAAALQPELMSAIGGDITALFASDAIVLSRSAADDLNIRRDDTLAVEVGGEIRLLRVIDILPGDVYPQPLGLMDIAAAQWSVRQLGRLDRIDIRLRAGIDLQRSRERLGALLPPGVFARSAQIERGRASAATRAYRVNLDMLALVALMTGAFVVFSTQWLSVLRRRVAIGLLRSLGVTRGELRTALLAESALGGIIGSVLGILLGALIASLMLHYLGADLGNRQLVSIGASLRLHAAPMLGFALIGTLAACAGGALPAWQAARRAPARLLRAGDAEQDAQRLSPTRSGIALVGAGIALAWLPPIAYLPLPGYASIAALLIGAVLLVPALTLRLLGTLPHSGHVVPDTAFAQLKGSLHSSSVSLASIIVSFSLMVAMAIMVHSFRDSFDVWLGKLLPADLQLRPPLGSDTATLSDTTQARLTDVRGVQRIEFRRTQSILLRADHAAVTLIARDLPARAADALPLVREAQRRAGGGAGDGDGDGAGAGGPPAAWVSEAVQDLYGYAPGQSLALPLAGRLRPFFIAGVWRDYVHGAGSIVIRRSDYIAATGDRSATEAAIWRQPRTELPALESALRAALGPGLAFELISTPELRARSLMAFDRAFAITYALEAIAVLIGLLGVSVAASSTALSRRAQFGVLRHLGMLRGQVLWMFASEGLALSGVAVLYGLLLGASLSLILVYVINRQSFNWSIDLAVPWLQLLSLSVSLIAASAITALSSARAAMSQDPINAVREDW